MREEIAELVQKKALELLFEMRSSGGKACRAKYGDEFYRENAKKSHIKRRENKLKKLSTVAVDKVTN